MYFKMTGLSYIPLIIKKLKQTRSEKIILFGSYAYGEPSDESDLDIFKILLRR
jgi:predicted nucleotidyltransferase